MADDLHNYIKRIVEGLVGQTPSPRRGVISSVDPKTMRAKVTLFGANGSYDTGWLPMLTPTLGEKWGILAVPSVGSQAVVMPTEADPNASVVLGGHWSQTQPPPTETDPDDTWETDEVWIWHKSGARLQLQNDGSIKLTDQKGATVLLNGSGAVTATDQKGALMSLDGTGKAFLAGASSGGHSASVVLGMDNTATLTADGIHLHGTLSVDGGPIINNGVTVVVP